MHSFQHMSAYVLIISLSLLLFNSINVNATTLTYKMAAHEKACFYATSEKIGEKIAFYFAVQSGGSFDIDYEVTDPEQKVVMSAYKERQGDFVFSAKHVGDYSFCFSNTMSTYSEKTIDFDVTVEREAGQTTSNVIDSSDPNKKTEKITKAKEDVKSLDEAITRIHQILSNYQRDQRFFKLRENRNFETVKSTEARIFWFSTTQSFLMVVTAFLQVFIIQTFFSKSSGRGRV